MKLGKTYGRLHKYISAALIITRSSVTCYICNGKRNSRLAKCFNCIYANFKRSTSTGERGAECTNALERIYANDNVGYNEEDGEKRCLKRYKAGCCVPEFLGQASLNFIVAICNPLFFFFFGAFVLHSCAAARMYELKFYILEILITR